MNKPNENSPQARLRHHVSGAIARGEAEAIVAQPAERTQEEQEQFDDAAQAEAFELGFAAGKRQAQQERDEARAQMADLLAACKAALNDINTARRHAYNWQPGRHLDHIEHTLEPTTRLLDAAIAAAEGRQS